MSDLLLSLENVTKLYPGVVAIDDVSVDFNKAEVHALVGENGAGKSTMIKVIAGAIKPERGNLVFENEKIENISPELIKKKGIEVVYQEFNLAPDLAVYENIFLGDYKKKGLFLDKKGMIEKTRRIFESLNIQIDPEIRVKDLTVAYMQLVEIAKAISKDVKVLIMDEPTAALTTAETEVLFKLIRRLKAEGVLVIYVSHRMEEIFSLADRVTVMRDGKKIKTLNIEDTSRKDLISHMVGREVSESYPERNVVIGNEVLRVENLTGNGVRNISFDLKKGEILGLAGLVGAGRTELVRLIYGAERPDSGSIFRNGKTVSINSPKDAVGQGIALIPEDRKQQGVLLEKSIRHNITLTILKKLRKGIIMDTAKEQAIIDRQSADLMIKSPSHEQLVKNLSGGNQQKVVLAKWLVTESDILIFDEPTRGIDVGAKQEIYKIMNGLVEAGKSIIMISSEMEELLGMSDRLIVMAEGDQVGSMEKDEFDKNKLLDMESGDK